jgi:hypothetical protein
LMNSMGCFLAISDGVGTLSIQLWTSPLGSEVLNCFALVLPSTGGGGSGPLHFFS